MTWKGDPAHAAGGALVEYGAHVLDLDRWLVGEPTEISARFLAVSDRSRLDDVAIVQLVHENGAWARSRRAGCWREASRGSGSSSTARPARARWCSTTRAPFAETYRRYDLSGHVVDECGYEPVPHHEYAQRQLADLLAVCAGRRPTHPGTLPSLADGAAVQRLLDRALSS